MIGNLWLDIIKLDFHVKLMTLITRMICMTYSNNMVFKLTSMGINMHLDMQLIVELDFI
jgi:hypothetical protein